MEATGTAAGVNNFQGMHINGDQIEDFRHEVISDKQLRQMTQHHRLFKVIIVGDTGK